MIIELVARPLPYARMGEVAAGRWETVSQRKYQEGWW